MAALVFLAYPLRRRYPDDQGDGWAVVLLPAPRLPSHLRFVGFAGCFVTLLVIYRSIAGSLALDPLYARLIVRIAGTVVRAPSEFAGYFSSFTLGLRALVVGSMLSLAIVVDASPARRALIALQSGCYLLAMVCLDALLTVIELLLGVPAGPASLFGGFVAIGVAALAMARLLFLNFALPKPSAVPFIARPRLGDALLLVGVTLAAVAISASALFYVYHLADPGLRAVLPILAPIPFGYTATVIRGAMLGLISITSSPPAPSLGEDRPPIDVIIPAYNEEEVIVETLQAIDRAAARYGGPVQVILANDGSTDETAALATATIEAFTAARGRMISVRHGGKSATLNSALAEATAEIVIRIDADTLIDEWCLVHVPRWFRDPRVGLVEAMMFPRWRRSLFPHMRLFEELKQFGFNHRTIQIVDGVNVVPGVFTACRREPAVYLGGFTVGMNGDDGDFTLRFSRLGYVSKFDPKVVVQEDVPPTYWEIREQRVRWDRATIHNDARHAPYRAGLGTPKVWFTHMRQFFARMFAPIRLAFPLYLLVIAGFDAGQRAAVLIFLGAWIVGSVAFLLMEVVLALGYRKERHLGWLVFWPYWQMCLTIFSVEAWLSLPARPAGLNGAVPQRVAEPVVH
ncbi:MAG: glycosyltransferase [Actinobacteria bacterium]|nr:glycosyltransferase [Actinomycetota bacterium]